MPSQSKKDFSSRIDELRLYLTPRFLLGIGLILSSLFAVLLLRASSDRWVTVLGATRTLAPGAIIREEDFTSVDIRTRGDIEKYLAQSAPIAGSRVLREIDEGELIPSSALTSEIDSSLRHLAISIPSSEIPFRLAQGESVDMYAVPDDRTTQRNDGSALMQSQLLLAGVGIDGIDSNSKGFGGNTTITFLIPDRLVERILNATINSKLVIVRR